MDELQIYGLQGVWAALAFLLAGLFFVFRWIYGMIREVKATVYAHKKELDTKDTDLERRVQRNEHNFDEAKTAYNRLEGQIATIASKIDDITREFQTVKEQNAQIIGWLSGRHKDGAWKD